MAKSIKLKNNNYIDSTGIVHNRKLLSQIINEIGLITHPVGSIYISANNTNPSTLFGGTWERIGDKFLWGTSNDNNIGNTGGSITNTLTESNLPSRAMIRQYVSGTKYGCGCNTAITNGWANICLVDGGFTYGQAINNMPPYLEVAIWKRTA